VAHGGGGAHRLWPHPRRAEHLSIDQALERTLAGLMERYRVPAAAVSVLRDGRPVFRAGLGTVSVDRPAPERRDGLHLQRWASRSEAMRYHLLAHGLGLPQQEFDARYRAALAGLGAGPRMMGGEPHFWRPLARVAGAGPSRDLTQYAGEYHHVGFGPVPVWLAADGLSADPLGTACALAHWNGSLPHTHTRARVTIFGRERVIWFGAPDGAVRLHRADGD
jgi:hypothetical protein